MGESEPGKRPCRDLISIDKAPDCCAAPAESSSPPAQTPARWIDQAVSTPIGDVPRATTTLEWADRLGTWRARWGVLRMRYAVAPGLYAVGTPGGDSPVFVSANYKMSFDWLRSSLSGIDAWILVLDTKGINVWCAAGKGTFGTDELVGRIAGTRLAEVVSRRTLIVPQLGAPGVSAHEVKERSGFRVVYGPVRADDLPAFLEARSQATPAMRRVRFSLQDRLAVIPVELVMSARYVLGIAAMFFFLAGFGADGYAWPRVLGFGTQSALLFMIAAVGSTLLTPTLLPWIPGRALAAKGAWLGLAFLLGLYGYLTVSPASMTSAFARAGWCLIIPSVASFMAMNYTGATTYTSLSGVRREVRRAVPLQATGALLGAVLWFAGRFV